MGAQATGGHYDNQSSEVGSEYWKYSWDEDDRLVQVSKGVYASGAVLVNEFTVHYSYDSMGRMLRRDNGTDVTTFVWDGWDLLSETTGSVTTTYLVPDGLVWSFSRGEDVFQVHTDALGSVRVVTDSDGDVVARFEYSAWGELLPGSFDNVGLALRFIGGLGVRTDLETGLLCMRHRWYDATLQRFISRDPVSVLGSRFSPLLGLLPDDLDQLPDFRQDDIRGQNTYVYGLNFPAQFADPSGLYIPSPESNRPRLPEPEPVPSENCEISYITKALCRATCESMGGSKKEKALCLKICDSLRGNSCNSLAAYCEHLKRHPPELGRKAAETCLLIYNELCSGQ